MSNPVSVSSLVQSVKSSLESEFSFVSVVGEISNFSRSSAGHLYFTLSDADSSISAVMFKGDVLRNTSAKSMKDGDKVICHGGLSVYAKRGTFQLIAKRVELVGAGDLKEQFEKLKRELSAQGLFDQDQKIAIPAYPKKVAVITAAGGAALQDFINVYKRRALQGEIVLVPALVQGEQSPRSLREALAKVIKYNLGNPDQSFDVVVLTRGGGSMEDLWSFNDEGLAWDIFNCPIPVISAVGHQVDYSISDFVSDLRCETPTAAAEILTGEQTKVLTQLQSIRSQLLRHSLTLKNMGPDRLERVSPKALSMILKEQTYELKQRLRECHLEDKIDSILGLSDLNLRMDDCLRKIERYPERSVAMTSQKIEKLGGLLKALNPKEVLGRGYSYVSDTNNNVISSKKNFDATKPSEKLVINFHDGFSKVTKGS
ncbi:MAG: exodeoxyribonuclease VII large subunit [Bdellovibrionales bacterium CG12_big_fil_rev_8_21_14_0_65_38_15]|nr:MAG: exodeoxyribonuclease VII large subunit [Bdellovibrionales bacterium CG12_big_fil_rev_8_21_14_0_65_38_15]